MKVVRLPAHSPNLNAHAERFVLSTRVDLLNRVIPLGEAHLRWLLREWIAHYHRERHHQGLDRLIAPDARAAGRGAVTCSERVGGLLRYYHRAAA